MLDGPSVQTISVDAFMAREADAILYAHIYGKTPPQSTPSHMIAMGGEVDASRMAVFDVPRMARQGIGELAQLTSDTEGHDPLVLEGVPAIQVN